MYNSKKYNLKKLNPKNSKLETFFSNQEESNPHNIKRSQLLAFLNRYSIFLHILLSCAICFIIEWISRHSFVDAFRFVFDRSLVFLYNSSIVYASLLLTYFFKRRFCVRTFISFLWLFLGTINGCILLKRVTPFSYTDLKLINDLFTMQSNYFTRAETILVVLCIVLVLSLIAVLWKKGPKFVGKPHRIVCMLSISAFAMLIPMVTNAAVSSNILAGYFENIAQGYEDYGFIYSFSASILDRGMTAPKGYSAETVNQVLQTQATGNTLSASDISSTGSSLPTSDISSTGDTIPTSETFATGKDMPNIICVLLESFVDPAEINFLETSIDPVPNFRKLKENFSSGYLSVPVVGAGTANSEFEILTGMGMQFFGLGEYPYKTILKTNSSESIAGNLSKLGYGTHVVHNNGGNFYSRANAFSQMGFDTFTSKEMINIQEYTPLGTWPTDNVLLDEVKKSMDFTPDQPDFVYTITVQGHGSYPTEPVIEHPEVIVSSADSPESNYAWEYYVNELHEVDKFIANLTDMLSKRDEKTIVVFFGDHLPTMGLTEENMASGSLFKTQYVTWNNFNMEKKDIDLCSYQLLAAITNEVGIHMGTMFQLHQKYRFSSSASSEDSAYYEAMNLLQYDILYGKRYAYKQQDIYPASNLVMGVADITITSSVPSGKMLSVTGTNFTPWSSIFLNGEKVHTTFISDTQLQCSMSNLQEADNRIIVNQMGSSNTIFRSSNEAFYTPVVSQSLSE
ncbi:sulfatase-like hydrolase/transferase [Lachnospiraceae bacterium ZAX-1]